MRALALRAQTVYQTLIIIHTQLGRVAGWLTYLPFRYSVIKTHCAHTLSGEHNVINLERHSRAMQSATIIRMARVADARPDVIGAALHL